jgi:hypothetical protein
LSLRRSLTVPAVEVHFLIDFYRRGERRRASVPTEVHGAGALSSEFTEGKDGHRTHVGVSGGIATFGLRSTVESDSAAGRDG